MVKNIIFDFGNIFISLNTNSFKRKLLLLGIYKVPKPLLDVWHEYEKGNISNQQFIGKIQQYTWWGSNAKIQHTWESLIGDFPKEKLDLLQNIKNEYRIFLLSNINQIHEDHIKQKLGADFYHQFINSFEKTYFSHHIQMRKPDLNIYQHVLTQNQLQPQQTLFVDDIAQNTQAAQKLGIKTWNLNPKTETVLNLHQKLKEIS